ncbi:MAG: methyl-accepting chemotaxis protein [Pseudomonadota bacterium]
MPEQYDIDNPSIGRFDKSFLVHMIKDFFVILLIVTILEFSLKVGLVYYGFQANGEAEATDAAEEIADNVRSIMLNEGGPVAARTLYPILEENWSNLGFKIAIEPTEVTKSSITELFGFVPEGVPVPEWPEGLHRAATIDIQAQEFCLGCHTQAAVGDVLGSVTVRTYLARDLALWWQDIQLTAALAVGKIILHSILLFILLRARLEPLLALRSVVSNLARAYGGLNHRADVKSSDEFGVLSRDLNLFLDRISRIVAELDTVLRRVVDVNDDILTIQSNLREQVDTVVGHARSLERRALINAKKEPLLSNAWFDAVKERIRLLDATLEGASGPPEAEELLETLRSVVANAEAQIRNNEELFEDLAQLGKETEGFQSAMAEMVRLEERMKLIVETGTLLVGRLRPAPAEETRAAE